MHFKVTFQASAKRSQKETVHRARLKQIIIRKSLVRRQSMNSPHNIKARYFQPWASAETHRPQNRSFFAEARPWLWRTFLRQSTRRTGSVEGSMHQNQCANRARTRSRRLALVIFIWLTSMCKRTANAIKLLRKGRTVPNLDFAGVSLRKAWSMTDKVDLNALRKCVSLMNVIISWMVGRLSASWLQKSRVQFGYCYVAAWTNWTIRGLYLSVCSSTALASFLVSAINSFLMLSKDLRAVS